MSNAVIAENRESYLLITFNRPEIRSPLSVEVLEAVDGFLDAEFAGRRRPVVISGRDGVFASGADLREIAALSAADARDFAIRGQSLMNKIADTFAIAAVNGYCFGGALDLALACRKRFAGPDAVFSHPGANLGIMTGWGGTQRLPGLIGAAAAAEMFFTAMRVSASEALRIGLVDRIVDDPVSAAEDFIIDAAAGSP